MFSVELWRELRRVVKRRYITVVSHHRLNGFDESLSILNESLLADKTFQRELSDFLVHVVTFSC